MTQQENGGALADDGIQTGTAGTDENGQDGGNDVQKQIEEMQLQIETLKKEKAGETKKAAKLLQEIKAKELAGKTAEEQLEFYKSQAAAFEKKEAFRQSFKETGLNPDEFLDIIDEQDFKIQAEKFSKLIKQKTEESAQKALEGFKKQELEKTGKVPNPTDTHTTSPNAAANEAIRAAFYNR